MNFDLCKEFVRMNLEAKINNFINTYIDDNEELEKLKQKLDKFKKNELTISEIDDFINYLENIVVEVDQERDYLLDIGAIKALYELFKQV